MSTSSKTFVLEHKGYQVQVTVWNESKTPPVVLYDYNNVLNTYSLPVLAKAAKLEDTLPYAIVSLLYTSGEHYQALQKRAESTGETVVALVVKIKGDRLQTETGLKYALMKRMHWLPNVRWAVDDKPHEWQSPRPTHSGVSVTSATSGIPQLLALDPTKKPVYLVPFLSGQ